MKTTAKVALHLLLISLLSFNISCELLNEDQSNLTESLESVEEVSLIPGGENVTITVNKGQHSFFKINLSDIEPGNSSVIVNGNTEGWCIDWQKPIDSDTGTYSGVKLYTTSGVEKWKKVNYLLNIREELDPDVTFREIQLAIWSLRTKPEFNLDKLSIEELPNTMRTDGKPNFSYEKVRDIMDIVEAGYKNYEFTPESKYAVVAETPVDIQTVIIVFE